MEIDCEHVATIEGIVNEMAGVITPYVATCGGLEPPEWQEFEYEHRKQLLSAATRMVAMLGLSIACYPLTATSVVFFDVDGNPIE